MKNYAINFTTQTITVSKSFQRRASQMGTEEFKTMMELHKLNMKIVTKAPSHKGDKRLTYNKIINYLKTFEDKESRLADFEAVRAASKVQDNPYQYVVKWFDETYPVRGVKPKLNENHKIILLPKANEKSEPAAQEKAEAAV